MRNRSQIGAIPVGFVVLFLATTIVGIAAGINAIKQPTRTTPQAQESSCFYLSAQISDIGDAFVTFNSYDSSGFDDIYLLRGTTLVAGPNRWNKSQAFTYSPPWTGAKLNTSGETVTFTGRDDNCGSRGNASTISCTLHANGSVTGTRCSQYGGGGGQTPPTQPPQATNPPSGNVQACSGNSCTDCILTYRSDILPYYRDTGGWDISCGNQNAIVANWCNLDPTGCNTVKRNYCAPRCGTISIPSPTPTKPVGSIPSNTPVPKQCNSGNCYTDCLCKFGDNIATKTYCDFTCANPTNTPIPSKTPTPTPPQNANCGYPGLNCCTRPPLCFVGECNQSTFNCETPSNPPPDQENEGSTITATVGISGDNPRVNEVSVFICGAGGVKQPCVGQNAQKKNNSEWFIYLRSDGNGSLIKQGEKYIVLKAVAYDQSGKTLAQTHDSELENFPVTAPATVNFRLSIPESNNQQPQVQKPIVERAVEKVQEVIFNKPPEPVGEAVPTAISGKVKINNSTNKSVFSSYVVLYDENKQALEPTANALSGSYSFNGLTSQDYIVKAWVRTTDGSWYQNNPCTPVGDDYDCRVKPGQTKDLAVDIGPQGPRALFLKAQDTSQNFVRNIKQTVENLPIIGPFIQIFIISAF